MYKNQLQELAQRSCFNLPSYTCIREGPDHAPRFKAAVNFNCEIFESPSFCTTLRQAEHSAAEVALNALSQRGPSHSLAARILDETGVYKNLLQEVAQRVGAPLPSYTTIRSGLGHLPVFTCTVELAGITFTGEPAKNKKQAEKNAASAAWSSLKRLAQQASSSSAEPDNSDEQEQNRIARALLNYRLKEKMAMAAISPLAASFPMRFPVQPDKRPLSMQPPQSTYSKILPLIRPKQTPKPKPDHAENDGSAPQMPGRSKFPAAGAAPYIPVRQLRMPCNAMAPPVTVRTAVPVFSAPPLPPPPAYARQLPPIIGHPPIRLASPVRIRPVVSAPPVQVKEATLAVKELPTAAVNSRVTMPPSVQIEVRAQQNEALPALTLETPPVAAAVPVQVKGAARPVFGAPPVQTTTPVIQPVQVKEATPVVEELPLATVNSLVTMPPPVQMESIDKQKEALLAMSLETRPVAAAPPVQVKEARPVIAAPPVQTATPLVLMESIAQQKEALPVMTVETPPVTAAPPVQVKEARLVIGAETSP